MKIGELAERSQVSTRMLRYYEEQGLLSPERGANGYRQYNMDDVETAQNVSSLVRSGLPTKLIVPLLRHRAVKERHSDVEARDEVEFRQLLQEELDRLDARITCMTLSRTTIASYLARK